MPDNLQKQQLKSKIRETQTELVRLSFSNEQDSQRHKTLLKVLNETRNQLSHGFYGGMS